MATDPQPPLPAGPMDRVLARLREHTAQLDLLGRAVAKAGTVPVPEPIRRASMKRLTAAGDRFGQARDLASVLDAACDAFEEILAVIGDYEDASDGLAVPLLLAVTQAANGRDAVLFAPSLPARHLHQPERAGEELQQGSAQDISSAVARLCQLDSHQATLRSHAHV